MAMASPSSCPPRLSSPHAHVGGGVGSATIAMTNRMVLPSRTCGARGIGKRWRRPAAAAAAVTRCSNREPQTGEEEGGVGSALDFARLTSDDLGYLQKLAAGSFGGASAIKYGSILFPDITKPNIVQALLMISLPVLVAIVILVKESSFGSEDILPLQLLETAEPSEDS